MDYEKEYKEALERAKNYHDNNFSFGTTQLTEAIFPELKESEDERIRKLLVWQVYRNIEDETNDLAGSVYDGVKGHDPDLEESIEDWKKCLAWLERQKEQNPAEWSEEDEKLLDAMIDMATNSLYEPLCPRGKMIALLKSLRPQPRWKPSEEQMEWLESAVKLSTDKPHIHGIIISLYEQLKRL